MTWETFRCDHWTIWIMSVGRWLQLAMSGFPTTFNNLPTTSPRSETTPNGQEDLSITQDPLQMEVRIWSNLSSLFGKKHVWLPFRIIILSQVEPSRRSLWIPNLFSIANKATSQNSSVKFGTWYPRHLPGQDKATYQSFCCQSVANSNVGISISCEIWVH